MSLAAENSVTLSAFKTLFRPTFLPDPPNVSHNQLIQTSHSTTNGLVADTCRVDVPGRAPQTVRQYEQSLDLLDRAH